MESSPPRKKFRDLQELNMEMIEGIPWAEEMWKLLLTVLTKTFLNWTQVALKMSNNTEDLKVWARVFTEHYEDTCCELVADIEQLKSNVIASIESLLQKVEELCKTLRIDMPALDIDNLCLYKVQHQLRKRVEELKRCGELKKKANIKVFVDKLRNELSTIWVQCHCAESVKEDFSYFVSDCYTEDLLELHEIELKKWRTYYEENREMLSLLNKHMKLWNKMIELEDSATRPDRYNNRGGKLLKEEKERNFLTKQIPKIEEILMELAYKFEKHHGFEFKTYDRTIDEYIHNMHAGRENARKEKLSARKIREQPMLTLTPAKSAICLFPGNPSMTSTSKRKPFDHPSTDTKMKIKSNSRLVATEPKKNRGYKGTVPRIILNTVTHSKRLSTERKKRIEKIRRRSALKQRNDTNRPASSTESDYVDFENEVSSRNDCRSTINPFLLPLPDPPISTASTSRTPIKTNSKQGSRRNRPEPGTPKNPTFSGSKN